MYKFIIAQVNAHMGNAGSGAFGFKEHQVALG
jgi:hypothetical protein